MFQDIRQPAKQEDLKINFPYEQDIIFVHSLFIWLLPLEHLVLGTQNLTLNL